ncbi:NUDIX hydrolase [soil metagenome]
MLKKLAGLIWRSLPRFVRAKTIRLTQDKFTVSVAAVITNEEGKVLLLEHVFRPASGWGIPGGFVEHGEQPEKAIRREIEEETGLSLENIEFYRARILKKHVEFIFEAQTKGAGEVRSREILTVEWFVRDDLPELMSTAQKATIEEVLAAKEKKS